MRRRICAFELAETVITLIPGSKGIHGSAWELLRDVRATRAGTRQSLGMGSFRRDVLIEAARGPNATPNALTSVHFAVESSRTAQNGRQGERLFSVDAIPRGCAVTGGCAGREGRHGPFAGYALRWVEALSESMLAVPGILTRSDAISCSAARIAYRGRRNDGQLACAAVGRKQGQAYISAWPESCTGCSIRFEATTARQWAGSTPGLAVDAMRCSFSSGVSAPCCRSVTLASF
jgi:hypothetical protein